MLCMEAYGLIMPIVDAVFSEGPAHAGGEKSACSFIVRSVSAGRWRLTQEAPGGDPEQFENE